MIKKKTIHTTVSVLLGSILLSSALPAYGAASPSGKEEVVYVMTDEQGKINNINVVNIFGSGSITDYGDYSNVKMLTTNDKITQNKDKITFTTTAEKAYYQGTMKDTEIPWNINIRYFLNGKEYSASTIAGQTGSLKILFQITKNEACEKDFFDNYALQASFTLDTDQCEKIKAEGATLANVGKNKQISYTILPGKGIDTTITADVTDFEMDAVAINGIKLDLNVEIDDQELMDKVTELMDATSELNDGADTLYDGTGTLADGSSSLKDGADSLNSGAQSLDSGIVTLQNGVITMQDGLDTLNDKSGTLTAGSSQVKGALETIQAGLNGVSIDTANIQTLVDSSGKIMAGIDALSTGASELQHNLGYAQYKALMAQNGLDIDNLKAQNTTVSGQLHTLGVYPDVVALLQANNAAISGTEAYLNGTAAAAGTLSTEMAGLQSSYTAFNGAIGEVALTMNNMVVSLTALKDGINQLTANYATLDSGISEYTNGVASLVNGYQQIVSGTASLASGSKELLEGSNSLTSGTQELYDGVASLYDGAGDLADGTKELNDQTSTMDTQVEDQIDTIMASIQGDETETISFVSDKNTNINSVQFVIKTAEIKKAEVEKVTDTNTKKKSILEKFLDLF